MTALRVRPVRPRVTVRRHFALPHAGLAKAGHPSLHPHYNRALRKWFGRKYRIAQKLVVVDTERIGNPVARVLGRSSEIVVVALAPIRRVKLENESDLAIRQWYLAPASRARHAIGVPAGIAHGNAFRRPVSAPVRTQRLVRPRQHDCTRS